MNTETRNRLGTDYRQILEHPTMTTDMKIGYLMAVVNIIPVGMSHMSLGQLSMEIRQFVSDYLRANV